jgi:hypothetical protein
MHTSSVTALIVEVLVISVNSQTAKAPLSLVAMSLLTQSSVPSLKKSGLAVL